MTPRVNHQTASTRIAPSCTISDDNAQKKSKVRNQASNLIQVTLEKKETRLPSSPPACLKVMHVNAQSCGQKSSALCVAISDDELDVALVTEAWLYSQGDEAYVVQMTPEGYFTNSFPRTGRRGGGIAVTVRSTLRISISLLYLSGVSH